MIFMIFLSMRLGFLLPCVLLSICMSGFGQDDNSIVPANKLHFTQQPNDSEISAARVFDEPLIPMGGQPTDEENRALAEALTRYANRTNLDDCSSLTEFLDRFPDSKWAGSLQLH